ncbi:MAG: SsrA-binding protein SmpB [Lachnospiraceae bacterium]|nr:SsrA-binding protein SmpB [Lachnospiraceae bacterium]
MSKDRVLMVAGNKKAYHDYFVLETFEAGIELVGTEVKAVRMGQVSIKEAFIRIDKNQAFVFGMHINPYEKGNLFNKDPLRIRRLLLHKKEIRKLAAASAEQGCTIVPLSVYLKGGLVKMEIGLVKGKKNYDKRDDIAKKDMRRETEREFKVKNL